MSQSTAAIAPDQLLQQWLGTRLQPQQSEWLERQRIQLAAGDPSRGLALAFASAPRRLGRAALALTDQELEAAQLARPMWSPVRWSIDQAARALLLLSAQGCHPALHAAAVDRLFCAADARELVALCQALPLLRDPQRWTRRAQEAVRSNMLDAFHAVALDNPYPSEAFDEEAWNRMVLKAAFLGSPLDAIVGLGDRMNPRLAAMLEDLLAERLAAGRSLGPDALRLLERSRRPAAGPDTERNPA